MFEKLSLKDFKELSRKNKRVALFQEFPSDMITPIIAFQLLEKHRPDMTLLESTERETHVGCYSYIGFNPIAELRSFGYKNEIRMGKEVSTKTGDPFEILRKMIKTYSCGSKVDLRGFAGGSFGYLSYDAVRYVENIPERNKDKKTMPDLFFQFHDQIIAFNHFKGLMIVIQIVDAQGGSDKVYVEGMKSISALKETITHTKVERTPFLKGKTDNTVTLDLSDEEYANVVKKAQEYIMNGDIFQVVPSRCFMKKYTVPPFKIYRALRLVSPAPYMFYFQCKDFSLAGSSPEKLVSLYGDEIESIPLAGTRPRTQGADEKEVEKEFLADPKEEAEHMMLVDLARNDLGRVAIPGSIYVDRLKTIQKFSHVMHLASFVKGTLDPKYDAIDLLKTTLPAGTLSGAPKIRAMEIIDELENTPRGPYGGAICMIDHAGNLNSCITIRTAILKDGVAKVRAGAGIVYDSVPLKEAEETRQKAEALLKAIQLAEEEEL